MFFVAMPLSSRISAIIVVFAFLVGLTGAIQPSTSVQESLAEVQTGAAAKTSVLPPAPANGAPFTDTEIFRYNPVVGARATVKHMLLHKVKQHKFRVPTAVTWPRGAEDAMPPFTVPYPAGLVLYHATMVDLANNNNQEVRFWKQPTWFAPRLGTAVAHLMKFRWDSPHDEELFIYEFHATRILNLVPNPPEEARYNSRLAQLFHIPLAAASTRYMGDSSPIGDIAGSHFCEGFRPNDLIALNARSNRPPHRADRNIVLPAQPVSYEGWRSPWDQNEVMLCPTSLGNAIQPRTQFKCSPLAICDAIKIIPAPGQQARSATPAECKAMFMDGIVTVGAHPNGTPIQGYDADIDHADVHGHRTAPATIFRLAPKTPTITLHGQTIVDLDTIVRKVCKKTKIKSHTIALV